MKYKRKKVKSVLPPIIVPMQELVKAVFGKRNRMNA